MKRMLIDANHEEETRVAILDRKQVLEFDYASTAKKQIKGNIYLAKVTRVEPSLQAAFVEYGGGRQGFLPFSEIHPDYYQIPVSDRKKLIEEVERELQEDAEEEEAEFEARQNRNSRRTRSRRSRRRKNDDASDKSGDNEKAKTASEASDEIANEKQEADSKADKSDDSAAKKDDPDTQYAKKEEPSVKSDVVEEKAADDKDEAKAEDKPKERKRRTRRSPLRGGRKRTAKKETEEKAVKETNESEDRLKVSPPTEVALGAALFSEENPFHLPEDNPHLQDDNAATNTEEAGSEEAEEGIETLDSEEESVKPARKKRVPFFKRYKIQEVVKRGQVVLVQATKEERGNKGASVTTYLSLAGRYCVLMPNSPRDGGVSRKISDIDTRKRLKDVMSQLKLSQGMSVIIRTAGVDRNRTEIRRDFDYLVKLWNQIRESTLSANAPALIYEENNLIKRAIRDLYTSDIDEVLVEGEEGYKESREFMKMLMPSHTSRVKEYKADMPLFYEHGIEDHLASMHDPVVKLKSGGYLVINPTEALISIDVNSGRSTGERNIEETAIKTNIEAAHEVARQLRLRDLAGLIVIDFIDMMDSRNRRAVERNLKDALRSDRAKIQVGRISPFGLMEMSRQRLRPSIGETMHTQCPTCAGRGLVHAPESLALYLVRTLEKEAVSGRYKELKLFVSQNIALYVLNHQRSLITGIEQRHGVNIMVEVDPNLGVSDYNIEKIKGSKPSRGKRNDSQDDSDEQDDRSRKGRGRRNDKNSRSKKKETDEDTVDSDEEEESKKKTRGRSSKTKKADKDDKKSKKKSEEASETEDDKELPEFTKRAATEDKKEEDKVVEMQKAPAEPLPDTTRPEGAPARKGWWQQMIELD